MAEIKEYPLLNAVNNEIDSLREIRTVHRKLFVAEENILLLKNSSMLKNTILLGKVKVKGKSKMFDVVFWASWHYMGAAICRLMDRTRSTVTLKSALEKEAKNHMHHSKYEELSDKLKTLEEDEHLKKILDARGQAIAHVSKNVAIGNEEPVGVSFKKVDEIAERIWLIMIDICSAINVPNDIVYDELLNESVDKLLEKIQ